MVKDTKNQFKYITSVELVKQIFTPIILKTGFEEDLQEVTRTKQGYKLRTCFDDGYACGSRYYFVENDFEVKNEERIVCEPETKLMRKYFVLDKKRGEEYTADLRNLLHNQVDEYIEELKEEAE